MLLLTSSTGSILHKWSLLLLALLKPLGAWGLFMLSLIDSSSIPLLIQPILIGYVAQDHARFLLYTFMATLGATIGSLVPYYLGRAGGELFLLKRINRERYEKIRDRFERQEFLAVMIPASLPPPTPLKLFEFAAGVFEMKAAWFFAAIFTGKFLQFLVLSLLTVRYGPAIGGVIGSGIRQHLSLLFGLLGSVLLLLLLLVARRVFARRRGLRLPVEESSS